MAGEARQDPKFAFGHYSEGLGDPIDYARSQVDHLVIHAPNHNAQPLVTSTLIELGIVDFDRLALPRPTESVVEIPRVGEWVALLQSLHNFDHITVLDTRADTSQRKIRAAKSALRHLLPKLPTHQIQIHPPLDIEPTDDAPNLVLHCADNRFQKEYESLIGDHGIGSFERYSFPGASRALHNTVAVQWIDDAIANGVRVVHVMDHTDCGAFGGMSQYDYQEHIEALEHARELGSASARIRQTSPNKNVFVLEHLVGFHGRMSVSELRRELKGSN